MRVTDEAVGEPALVVARVRVIEPRVALEHRLAADVSLPGQRHRQHRVAHGGALAQRAAAAACPFEIAGRQARAERDRAVHLVFGEPHDLRGGDGRAEDAEHHAGVEAARHHRGNEVGGHPLHDLVARGETGEEVAAGGPAGLRGHEGAGDDARAGMGQHAKGVPLAAGHRHLGVRERGTASRHPGAVHHDGGATLHAGLFVADQLHRLAPARRQRAEQHRREPVECDALGAIDHRGRKIVKAKPDDPLRELPAERCHRVRLLDS